jgi:hypothetical protein
MYLTQILGWCRSSILGAKGRLLIAKSEYVASSREAFLLDHMVPFMFPHTDGTSTDTVTMSNGREQVLNRIQSTGGLHKAKNSKSVKDPRAHLSPHMKKRLNDFYAKTDLQHFLYYLQLKKHAVVVPPLSSDDELWWPQYNSTDY